MSDLVDGLLALMNSNFTLPVNLGNPVEHTINGIRIFLHQNKYISVIFYLEFASIIKDLVGGSSKIVHVAEVEDDPQRRRPDITRAKLYLKWEPKVSLNVGLQKTVDYFKKELKRFYNSHKSKEKQNKEE